MTNDILDLVTQIVARDVSTGVEMARSIGHKMPKNFAIGVRIAGVTPGKNGEVTRVASGVRETSTEADLLEDHEVECLIQTSRLESGQASQRSRTSRWRTCSTC